MTSEPLHEATSALPAARRRRRNPLPYIAALLALAAVVGVLLWGSLQKSLEFFVTPSEYQAQQSTLAGRSLRLGGLVKAEKYDPATLQLHFTITDGNASYPVSYRGAVPDLFKENQGVVVRGHFENGTFLGQELLVKHSEEYHPPKTPGDVKKLLEDTK